MKKWILLITIILLSGSCAHTPVVTAVQLKCPPPLELPLMTEEQASALLFFSKDIYYILFTRDQLLKERNATLCAIIESTH